MPIPDPLKQAAKAAPKPTSATASKAPTEDPKKAAPVAVSKPELKKENSSLGQKPAFSKPAAKPGAKVSQVKRSDSALFKAFNKPKQQPKLNREDSGASVATNTSVATPQPVRRNRVSFV